MKTFGFSFFILYAFGTTEANRLRGMFSAMDIYDQRKHNAPLPSPDPYLPILPPTDNVPKFHSPFENNFLPTNHNEPPSNDPQLKINRNSPMGYGG